jgi:rod shape-determining protein MreD
MKAVWWTLVGLLVSLLVESGFSRVAPSGARLFDPFLLVFVYCALTGGETHGMLAGVAAGWVQDIHFGGRLLGLTGLTNVLLGFAVGLAGNRFLLVSVPSRLLVVFVTTLAQAFLFKSSASIFDIHIHALSATGLLLRSLANALVGIVAFDFADGRLRRSLRT